VLASSGCSRRHRGPADTDSRAKHVTRDRPAVIDAALMTNPNPTQGHANGEPSHYNIVAISFEDDQNA
jgi:hypothetical protein